MSAHTCLALPGIQCQGTAHVLPLPASQPRVFSQATVPIPSADILTCTYMPASCSFLSDACTATSFEPVPAHAATLQGCGLVEFAQHSEAAAALQTLGGRYVWPGTRTVMTLEWYLPAKHDVFAIEQAPPANRQGPRGAHQYSQHSAVEAAFQKQQRQQLGSPAAMYSTTWQP